MNRFDLPRTLLWNSDHLFVGNARRRRRKLRLLARLFKFSDIAIVLEPNATASEIPALESWAQRQGWGMAYTLSDHDFRFGVLIFWRLSWLGGRVALPSILLTRFALRVEFWDPKDAPDLSAPSLRRHGVLSHITNGVYLKQGDPRWQVLRLRRLGLRLTEARALLSSSSYSRRCLEVLSGDWNFALDRADRWVLPKDGRPGHWAFRVGAAGSPGARFREIFLNQGFRFSEVPNSFLTLRGKSGEYLGNNDRLYVSWCGLAQRVARMGTSLVSEPGDLSDHGGVLLRIEALPGSSRSFPAWTAGGRNKDEFGQRLRSKMAHWGVPRNAWIADRLYSAAAWETALEIEDRARRRAEAMDPEYEIQYALGTFAKVWFGPRLGQSSSAWSREIFSRLLRLPRLAALLRSSWCFDDGAARVEFEWDQRELDAYFTDANSSDYKLRIREIASAEREAQTKLPLAREAAAKRHRQRAGVGFVPWAALRTSDGSLAVEDRDIVSEGLRYWCFSSPEVPDSGWDDAFRGYSKRYPAVDPPELSSFSRAIAISQRSGVGDDRLPLEIYKASPAEAASLCLGIFQELSSEAVVPAPPSADAPMVGGAPGQPSDFNRMVLALVLKKRWEDVPSLGIVVTLPDTRPISISRHLRRLVCTGVRLVFQVPLAGFVHEVQYLGREIASNVAECSAELEIMRSQGTRGGLGLLDLHQAFPSVHWRWLHEWFTRVRVELWFVRFHWASYFRAFHSFARGGWRAFGAWVWLGVLQGDPLAMMIFCCAFDVHIVRIMLKLRPRERGFGWADDLTFKLHSIVRLIVPLSEIALLEPFSNLHLSRGKIHWLQALKPSAAELARWLAWALRHGWADVPILWEDIQLGVPIGVHTSADAAFEPTMGKVWAVMKRWRAFDGAPSARLEVLNIFINSKVQYLCQFYPPPSQLTNQLRKSNVAFVSGLNLCRASLLARLRDWGSRVELQDAPEVAVCAMLRCAFFSPLSLATNAALDRHPSARGFPRCIPQQWRVTTAAHNSSSAVSVQVEFDLLVAKKAAALEAACLAVSAPVPDPDLLRGQAEIWAKKNLQKHIRLRRRRSSPWDQDRRYWLRRLGRFGAGDLVFRRLRREVSVWKRLKPACRFLMGGLRLLLNGFHTSSRHQEPPQPCCFCGRLDHARGVYDDVKHFVFCRILSHIALRLGLILPRPLSLDSPCSPPLPSVWWTEWLRGRFGAGLPEARRNRHFSFLVFCEALYTVHNHRRHGLEFLPPDRLARAIRNQMSLSQLRGLRTLRSRARDETGLVVFDPG